MLQICSEGKKVVGEESDILSQKAEDTGIREVTDNGIRTVDTNAAAAAAPAAAAVKIEEQQQPSSASPAATPSQSRPAKRRITPMAID